MWALKKNIGLTTNSLKTGGLEKGTNISNNRFSLGFQQLLLNLTIGRGLENKKHTLYFFMYKIYWLQLCFESYHSWLGLNIPKTMGKKVAVRHIKGELSTKCTISRHEIWVLEALVNGVWANWQAMWLSLTFRSRSNKSEKGSNAYHVFCWLSPWLPRTNSAHIIVWGGILNITSMSVHFLMKHPI